MNASLKVSLNAASHAARVANIAVSLCLLRKGAHNKADSLNSVSYLLGSLVFLRRK
jgi:hypothetical protein